VLHPDLEEVLAPALAVLGNTPVTFPQFCAALDRHMDHSRPLSQVYLLTKVQPAWLCTCAVLAVFLVRFVLLQTCSQLSKLAKLIEEKDARELFGVTHSPAINDASRHIEGRSVEQQYLYHDLYRQRRAELVRKAAQDELAPCTFKPKTNKACALLAYEYPTTCCTTVAPCRCQLTRRERSDPVSRFLRLPPLRPLDHRCLCSLVTMALVLPRCRLWLQYNPRWQSLPRKLHFRRQ
jgi:hypothetical protein